MSDERDAASGFTLLELMTVCAIIGVLAMLAYPNILRFQAQQQTKAGAAQMAGVLGEARARATSEATPYLVYFNQKTVDGNGKCGPAATLVRDSDRSYSISAGDDVRDVALPEGACENVEPYSESAAPALADVHLPVEDMSARALEVLGLTATAGAAVVASPGKSAGKGNSKASTVSDAKVADAVVNGATFPADAASGRPVVAFSERGIPVDPQSPASWGSGAGAVYVTDGRSTVYAAVVQPLGNVQLRVFDNVAGEWR